MCVINLDLQLKDFRLATIVRVPEQMLCRNDALASEEIVYDRSSSKKFNMTMRTKPFFDKQQVLGFNFTKTHIINNGCPTAV